MPEVTLNGTLLKLSNGITRVKFIDNIIDLYS